MVNWYYICSKMELYYFHYYMSCVIVFFFIHFVNKKNSTCGVLY